VPSVGSVTALANTAIANQRDAYASTGINNSPFASSVSAGTNSLLGKGWSGVLQLENAYTAAGGGYNLTVTDYDLQSVLAEFAWQSQWTLTLSTLEFEVDDTLRGLDFVGAKDGGWSVIGLDFDITQNTNQRTNIVSGEQEFYLDLTASKPTIGNLEHIQVGYRDDVAGGQGTYLNYPGLGVGSTSGISHSHDLDFNALFPSDTYNNMKPT